MKAGICAAVLPIMMVGCKGPTRSSEVLVDRYANAVEVRLTGPGAPAALCGLPRRERRAALVVALSAEKCLGCDEVGFVLRSLTRDASRRQAALVVAIPDSAAYLVCPFLRRERLLGVLTVEGIERLPWQVTPAEDGYLKYERPSPGAAVQARFVRSAMELLLDTLKMPEH